MIALVWADARTHLHSSSIRMAISTRVAGIVLSFRRPLGKIGISQCFVLVCCACQRFQLDIYLSCCYEIHIAQFGGCDSIDSVPGLISACLPQRIWFLLELSLVKCQPIRCIDETNWKGITNRETSFDFVCPNRREWCGLSCGNVSDVFTVYEMYWQYTYNGQMMLNMSVIYRKKGKRNNGIDDFVYSVWITRDREKELVFVPSSNVIINWQLNACQ